MTASHPPDGMRLARIAAAVRAYSPIFAARDGEWYEAAVALILREARGGALELLFIERATRESDPWSGQIAFPGGRREPIDGSLEDTVARETREEVGLDLRRGGVIVGALDELRPRTIVLPPVIVRPFVATAQADARVQSVGEVAGFFWAPLDAILDPAAAGEREIVARGTSAPRPSIEYAGRVIWGITERIIRRFEQIIRFSVAPERKTGQ
jgi:8-oxo-dGTP pyrophosphatase MutT (NUDIX family)